MSNHHKKLTVIKNEQKNLYMENEHYVQDIQLEEPKNINQINKIIMSNDDIWRII